jgi:hypothetical protein
MTKLQIRKRNDMTIFIGWTRKAVEYKPIGHESSDARREDGKMTSEDSYMIGTDLMVYQDVLDEDDVTVLCGLIM